MIGDALEITIIVSMAVLVGYPSSLMIMGMFQERSRRRVKPAEPLDRHEGR